MLFQTIDPTVPNSITELFFLSEQNVLKPTHKELLASSIICMCWNVFLRAIIEKMETFGKYGVCSSSNALRRIHFSILPGFICQKSKAKLFRQGEGNQTAYSLG